MVVHSTVPTSTTKRRSPARIGALLGVLASASWLTIALDSIVRPHPHNYRDVALVAPWVLTMAVLSVVHYLQRDTAGRLERVGYWAVMATMVASVPVELGLGLGWKHFTDTAWPAIMLWIPAMVLFGIGTARAGVMGRGAGIAIALSEPLTMLTAMALSPISPLADNGSYSGAVVHATVLLLLAIRLQRLAARHPEPGARSVRTSPARSLG